MEYKKIQSIFEDFYFSKKAIINNIIMTKPLIEEKIETLKKALLDSTVTNDKSGLPEEVDRILSDISLDNPLINDDIKTALNSISSKLANLGFKLINNSILIYDNTEIIEELYALNIQNVSIFDDAITNLVSSYEKFIYEYLKIFYTKNHDKISHDRTLNINHLIYSKERNTINDLIELLASMESEIFLRKKARDYNNDLYCVHTKNHEYFNKIKTKVNELFARRNLITHNKGHVNSQYKNESDNLLNLKDGVRIETDLNYVIEMSNILLTLVILLVIESLSNQLKDKSNKLNEYSNKLYLTIEKTSFNILKQEDWLNCFYIYKKLLDFDVYNKTNFREGFTLNYYLCGKKIGDTEILKKIDSYDYSSRDPLFKLGFLGLIADYDNFIRTLKKNKDKINLLSLYEWPIFIDLRTLDPEKFKQIEQVLMDNAINKD